METVDMVRAWMAEQAIPLSLLLGFFVLGGLTLLLSVLGDRRQVERSRAGGDVGSFTRGLAKDGLDPQICRETYRYLAEHEHIAFAIHPDDLVDEDLGMNEVAVTKMVFAVAEKCERLAMPKLLKIETVRDVIRCVQQSPYCSRMAA